MVYHWQDIPAGAFYTDAPVGYEVTVNMSNKFESRMMLAAMCLNVGYYIGLHEADRQKGEAEAVAEEIRKRDTWSGDLNRKLCELAGLAEEYEAADGETFESVVYKAAEKLGVEI